VANVQPVGVLTGNLVNFLISQGADRLEFHLMGFSLGAHVVGRAGQTAFNNIIPRITGSNTFQFRDDVDNFVTIRCTSKDLTRHSRVSKKPVGTKSSTVRTLSL
jgi:Lipase